MVFNHLSDGEFEEFTYDLLRELGFVNLSWRRGSGKGGASADQGRDIVADLPRRDVDKTEHLERWFVQCKQHERGVSPDALQSAVVWASAERPAVLLFVVSNFLSNPAKTWIDDYEKNNRPPFRVKVWERKDLEQLTSSHLELATKYKLELANLTPNVHPAHLQYMLRPSFNSLDYLFETLDLVDREVRDQVLDFSFFSLLNPRFRKAETGNEKMIDLMIDVVDYAAFRRRCYELSSQGVAEDFLVRAVVSEALTWAWDGGDPSKVDEVIRRHRGFIAFCEKALLTEKNEQRRSSLEGMIERSREGIASAPDNQKRWASHYKTLCEVVLSRLPLEDPLRPFKPR